MSLGQRMRRVGAGAFIVDRKGTILGFDEGMERLTRYSAIDIVGRHKDLDGARNGHDAGGTDGASPLYRGEIPMVHTARPIELTVFHADGSSLEIEARVQRLEGPGDRVQVNVLRVLGHTRDQAHPEERPFVDALTGLPNREAFRARLAAAFANASDRAVPLALILADIDRLRLINDRLGRDAGDLVLQKLAAILRTQVGDEKAIFRLADDDFAILLPHHGRGDARQVAAGVRMASDQLKIQVEGQEAPRLTLSIGSASFPADAETSGDLFSRAQDALDEARRMGRNRVWCYLRRPRVPLEVPVYFDAAEALLVGYTRDLSPSGLFVQTSAPIEIGMRCALAFPLPGYDDKVHVIGRVVRTVPTETRDNGHAARVPGMGVEFERFGGQSDRGAIDAYLHAHEDRTLRPETGLLSL